MTILAFEGFDLYNGNQANIGFAATWNNVIWDYGRAPNLGAGRFGGQSIYGTNEANCISGLSMPSANNAFAVCAAFKTVDYSLINATVPYGNVQITSGAFANSQLSWRASPTGQIIIYRGNTELGRTAAVLLTNVWHFIEFFGTISLTTGSVTIKVDGVQQLALINQNTNNYTTTTTFDGVVIGAQNYGGMNFYFDDFYVTDGVSLGERRVETLRPASDVSKLWLPDTGTVNFSRVNAAVAQATTFIQAANLNDADLYTLSQLASVPATVDAVKPVIFAQKTDAAVRAIAAVLDIATVQTVTPNFALGSSISKYSAIMPTKPGGGAWTGAAVNSLRAGPKVLV